MTLKKPKIDKVLEPIVQRNFDAIDDFLAIIANISILDNVLLEGIEFTAPGIYRISHTLNRAPKGFVIVDKNASVDIWRVPDPELDNPTNPVLSRSIDSSFLVVQASAAATVSILVF